MARRRPIKNANRKLRPTATMNSNNVEIDSIYNHSVPKKLNNTYDSWSNNMWDSGVFRYENFFNATKQEINDYLDTIKNKYTARDLGKIEQELLNYTNSAKLERFMRNDLEAFNAKGFEGKVFNYKGQRYVATGVNTFGYLESGANAAPVQMQVINLDTNEIMNFGHEFKNPDLDASDAINDGFYYESIINDMELTGETIDLKEYPNQVQAAGGRFNLVQERDEVINSINRKVNERQTQNTQPEPEVDMPDPEPEPETPKKGYESRSRTFNMDDGSVVKQYYDRDGNIRAQVREWQDGRREVRRQHTAQTIKKDPLAKNMSAAVSNYDGETTSIHRRPNGKHFSETTINHKTGEVVSTRSQRNANWGGGVVAQETHRTTIKDLRDAHVEKINKKYDLDGHTTAIETGIDDSIHVQNNRNISSKYKNKRQRGRTGTGQATGRGNKKINRNTSGRGRTSSGGVEPKSKARRVIKKGGEFGRGGKPTKLRPIGRNGKPISSIPRKIPTSKKDLIKTAANLIVNEVANETIEKAVNNIDFGNTADDFDNFKTPDFDVPNGYDSDPTTWTDEDIKDMADGDPDLYQELSNRREQARNGGGEGGDTNTDPNKFANDPNDPTTWSDDYIEEMSEGDPHYYEELRRRREKAFEEAINAQGSKPPGPFSDGFDPNDPSTWTDNDRRRMNTPDQWTDDDIRRLADGDMDRANELNRMRNGEFGPYNHNPMNDFEFDDAPIPDTSYKHAPDTEILDDSISTKTLSKMDIAMTGLNIIGAIGDYKSYRREGDGVISAGVKAGAKFAIEEALGFWALPIALVKTVPGLAIKGADALYKENRRMNSAANFTLFGDAQFMDTQQLATMRQSGMEMAKMSQYNLQQTLMGNEATYLHR